MKRFVFLLLLLPSLPVLSQQLVLLDSGRTTSLRGMSVPTSTTIWVCGSKGTVGRSVNGGKVFEWMTVAGHEHRDFRDIEAFDAQTAIIMAVDTPALLLKTTDGGRNWKTVLQDRRPGMFLDALYFWNSMSGIVVGDPIEGRIYIARTFDGGNTWRGLPPAYYPTAEPGEAFFAASGTNITGLNRQEAVFVTGGAHSRLFIRDQKIDLPVIQGGTLTGANSIAVYDEKRIVIVAGDYQRDTARAGNCVLTSDKGKTFIRPATPPFGYRSCVIYVTKERLVACGTTGVDVSTDG
ncbi:MAG TPA: YCF48-related protein, partial [Lacibacter sp.]|nr:YCF48-related protein [Lacibacter sp.]